MGGGLYGDASGREWEAEVVANSTGSRHLEISNKHS